MRIVAALILPLALTPAQDPETRIGVAAVSNGQHCLALPGPAPADGSPVTLITPTSPQEIYRGRIKRPLATCESMARQDTTGPFYELALDAGANEPPALAVAIMGRINARTVGEECRLQLDTRYRVAQVRSCSSQEGLHLTLWSGEPLKSVRLWHSYWYLGFDVEPDCQQGEYEGGGK